MPFLWSLDLCAAKTNCVDTTITNLLEHKDEGPMEATGTTSSGSSRNSSYPSGPTPTITVRCSLNI